MENQKTYLGVYIHIYGNLHFIKLIILDNHPIILYGNVDVGLELNNHPR